MSEAVEVTRPSGVNLKVETTITRALDADDLRWFVSGFLDAVKELEDASAKTVSYWTVGGDMPGHGAVELTITLPGRETPAKKAERFRSALREVQRRVRWGGDAEAVLADIQRLVNGALEGELP